MNDQFKKIVDDCQNTAYQISKQTGIPYTTISELINGKIDINKCAAETVFRLSLYFKCSMEELLNPGPLITNKMGIYRAVKYHWKPGKEGTVDLHVLDGGKDIILDTGNYSQPRFYAAYQDMTELIIDEFLERRESEVLLDD